MFQRNILLLRLQNERTNKKVGEVWFFNENHEFEGNKLKWVVNFIKTGVYCPVLLGIWESNNFFRISNHDDLDISLPVFPSRTNLKQCNIFAVPKLVRKVITNFDLSNASDIDSITVVVLKNSEPKHSYILAELFNMCLKESHL